MMQRLGLQTRLAVVGLPATLGLAVVAALIAGGRGDVVNSAGFAAAAIALAVVGVVLLVVVGRRTGSELDWVAHVASSIGPDALLTQLPGDDEAMWRPRRPPALDDETDAVSAPLVDALRSLERAAIGAAIRHGEEVWHGIGEAVLRQAQRSQGLLDRQLALLDDFEDDELDPDGLERLFRLDHLATQMRRRNDGLIVLSGARTVDRQGQPVAILDVLRGAVSAVESFTRVTIQSTAVVALPGTLASDLALLVAELVDNAVRATHAETPVQLTAAMTGTGLMIDVVDAGPGLPESERRRLDRLTSQAPHDASPAAGRGLGFVVVAQLAARHGLRVSLGAASPQGTRATVEVPASLVGRGRTEAAAADDGTAVPIVLAQVRRHDRLAATFDGDPSGPEHSPFVVWQPQSARSAPAPVAETGAREPTRFRPMAPAAACGGERVPVGAVEPGVHVPPWLPDRSEPAAHLSADASGAPGWPASPTSPTSPTSSALPASPAPSRPPATPPPAPSPGPTSRRGPASSAAPDPEIAGRVAGEASLFRLADTGVSTPSSLLGTSDPVVAGGLVRRVPGATLGSDATTPGPRAPRSDPRAHTPRHDPDEVRARMAAYRRGVELGRGGAGAADPHQGA